MNVFILNSGRCGSTTWIRACGYIENFTAGHESRAHLPGVARLDYPEGHIEADNRLSWMLGSLHNRFGDDACYVHLQRAHAATLASFVRRDGSGIMRAWREGVMIDADPGLPAEQVAADYLAAVEANIAHFLRDKSHRLAVRLEDWRSDFPRFWEAIGARGDLQAALAEFGVRHNASDALTH